MLITSKMRPYLLSILLSLLCMAAASAKDVVRHFISPTPRMHCESCEKKIRRVLQFEKGMKDIQFDLEKNTILIVFDPTKTSLEKLATKLEKIGYEIEVTDESGRPLPKKEKN